MIKPFIYLKQYKMLVYSKCGYTNIADKAITHLQLKHTKLQLQNQICKISHTVQDMPI